MIDLLAPGFASDPGRFALAVELTRITFPYLLLITLVTLYGGILNALQRFAAAAAAPILLNLSMMVTLLLAAFFPTAGHAAAWGVLISGVLQAALVGGDAWRAGALPALRWPQLDADVRAFFRALGPATVGSAGVQLALFADTIIASFLATGALSALYYADRINQLPIGVIGIAAGTVVLPEMARRIAAGDEAGAAHAQNRAIEFTLLLSVPCLAAFFVMPELIMRALFMRGAFTAGRCGRRRADARGLCLRPAALRADPQHGRDLLRARRHRDAGEGRADRRRRQYRLQDPADGAAGAGRSCVRDLDRRLDQSRSGDLVCDARRPHRDRRALAAIDDQTGGRRPRSGCRAVALRRRRSRIYSPAGSVCATWRRWRCSPRIGGVVYGGIVIVLFGPRWLEAFRARRR